MLDNKSMRILSEIMKNPDGTKISYLMEGLNLSRRTVYYHLDRINYWLNENGLSEIKGSKSRGLLIHQDVLRQIEALLPKAIEYAYEFSQEERSSLLVICISSSFEKLNIKNLCDVLGISKTTLIKDLKWVNEILSPDNCAIEFARSLGYKLVGQEASIRNVMGKAVLHLLNEMETNLFLGKLQMFYRANGVHWNFEKLIPMIRGLITDSERFLEKEYTENMIRFLSFYTLILIPRWQKGAFIEYPEEAFAQVSNTNEFMASKLYLSKLSDIFRFPKNPMETTHFAIQLLCASMNQHDVFRENDLQNKIQSEIIPELIEAFERKACNQFDNRDLLSKNLVMHMIPAYYRCKYNIKIENPIKGDIIARYYELFCLTSIALRTVEEKLDIVFDVSEISYFAMHFGSWMGKGSPLIDSKRIVVVCPSGLATSNFIINQIRVLIPEHFTIMNLSVREYEASRPESDLVIATTRLDETSGIIYVSPILTSEDKKKILRCVGINDNSINKLDTIDEIMRIVENHCFIPDYERLKNDIKEYLTTDIHLQGGQYKPMLKELLISEHINIRNKVIDWKEGIKIAAGPLLQGKYISPAYIDAMINTVIEIGPYFIVAPDIAIPHAKPENGVKRIGMSLLKLDEAVYFSSSEAHRVKLIIVLASTDSSTHLKALAQLTDLLSNEKEVEALLNASKTSEISEIIQNYK